MKGPGGPAVLSSLPACKTQLSLLGFRQSPGAMKLERIYFGDASATDLWAQRYQVSKSVGNGVGSSPARLPQAQNNIFGGLRPDGVRRKHAYFVLLLP